VEPEQHSAPAGANDESPPEAAAHDAGESAAPSAEPFQADLIEADLADVEVALARLDAGTYWTDEVTGEALPDALLEARPAARRA
jgi:DnaK suppressor protein